MVTEPKAIILALRQIAEVFDKEFLREHKHSPVSIGINDGIFTLHYMFESTDTRPDLKENLRGWTVFATAKVNMETGEAWLEDYILPEGTRL